MWDLIVSVSRSLVIFFTLFQHFSSYYIQVYIVLITGQVDKQ